MEKAYYFLLLFVAFSFFSKAQQLAFPTAEGIGRFTTGGRGTTASPTKVFIVNSLADDGSVGTLRYALTTTATYRTVVFNISGTIHLTSKLNIKANTTIAGQTAPAGGICVADYNVTISGDNVVLRYMRFRLGDKNQLLTSPANCGVPVAPFSSACTPVNGSGGDDALSASGRKNIIIDHCTFSWSNDESCSVYSGDSTTMQWCMFSEPLNYSYHFETGDADFEHHGYGGIWGGKNATFHHNLLAHCQGRACRFDGSRNLGNGSTAGLENCEFSNNVIYNWGAYNVNGGEGGNYNIRNNYYKYGSNTSNKKMIINPYSTAPLTWGKYYVNGNYVDGSTANTNNNWLGCIVSGGTAADTISIKVTTPFNNLGINLQTAQNAYTDVVAQVGCNIPSHDTLEKRILGNVQNRTGKIIDCQGNYAHGTAYNLTINAWPTLANGNVSLDNDVDGMPNWWEDRNELNKTLASDRAIVAANGYTNLENYLDSIPAWNKHALYENFNGGKISSTTARFNFSTNWVKDSFTYGLFRSPDSLGVYTEVANIASSMNNVSFSIDDNNLPTTTIYYKVGSYKVGYTPDTLYTNIIKVDGILPIILTNFTATIQHNNNKKQVTTNWQTSSEINAKQFVVQRSVDANSFINIGTVEAKGSYTNYSFIDENLPKENIIYYRLMLVDNNGNKDYSQIIKLNSNAKNYTVFVYPNPAKNFINIESNDAIIELKIYNQLGQQILLSKANNQYKYKLSLNKYQLPRGIYTLQIKNNKQEWLYEKIIVE